MHRGIVTALAGLGLMACGAARAEMVDCVISPAVTVHVGAPISGLIDEVRVDQGDVVTRGQIIATLRSEVEEKSVELLAVQAASRSEIEAQKSRLALSRKRLERAQELMVRNVGTREQLDEAEAEAEVTAGELAIAEMKAQVAGLELERARAQLEQRVIRSPVDGVVVSRELYSGEFLHTEADVATIAQIDPLHVTAYLPVTLFQQLTPGVVLQVHPDPPVSGIYPAKVEVIDRVFDPASRTFGIRLSLPNADGALPAGHRCQLDLAVAGQ